MQLIKKSKKILGSQREKSKDKFSVYWNLLSFEDDSKAGSEEARDCSEEERGQEHPEDVCKERSAGERRNGKANEAQGNPVWNNR